METIRPGFSTGVFFAGSQQMRKPDNKIWAGVVIAAALAAGFIAVVRMDSGGKEGSGLPKEYLYELEEFEKIDPSKILYEQAGETIKTGLTHSLAICVGPDGGIYVAGDNSIIVFKGGERKTIELSAEPTCIAVLADGKILAGPGSRIVVLAADGRKIADWPQVSEKSIFTSIAFDRDFVFVADAALALIHRFGYDGKLIDSFGAADPLENKPGFVIPSPYFDIAMAPDGLLRAVNPGRCLIEAWTRDGHREWAWGRRSAKLEDFCGCCNPVNIAILPDGGFVTVEKGLVRVKVYDGDGNFVGVAAGPQQLQWAGPVRVCERVEDCGAKGFDVAVDGQGRIYVLDTVNNVVRIFEKKVTF